ncbi:phospholipid metabolism enzyme regulator [Histoplasma capsulatum]|uniref:Phospholipid metabolism enzyme regulator n=1 Tax=Ajellomyces capsulatus TaxID=5037 RepID=A0A8A1MBP9_AJECA|nr:phospholipid metabolism enzyme regulator [Histoplasma capsulatum]
MSHPWGAQTARAKEPPSLRSTAASEKSRKLPCPSPLLLRSTSNKYRSFLAVRDRGGLWGLGSRHGNATEQPGLARVDKVGKLAASQAKHFGLLCFSIQREPSSPDCLALDSTPVLLLSSLPTGTVTQRYRLLGNFLVGVTIAGGLELAARLALLSLCGRKRPNFRVRWASLGFSTCVCPIGLVLLKRLPPRDYPNHDLRFRSLTAVTRTSDNEHPALPSLNYLLYDIYFRTKGSSGAGSILETVQEAGALLEPPVPGNREENVEESAPFVAKTGVESGSDSGGNRGKPRISPANARPGDIISKRSFSSLSSTRGKLGDTPARNMIIEAETVSSIPQVSLGGGAGERSAAVRTDTSGSVRLKASDETIRPKKEKKKPVRRPTALPAGTVSSKADIFEAKVASAVDEADSSDSAETFIYESNPPDSRPAHPLRYHSRTPSSTSMASQADQYGVRPRLGLRDHTVTGKRSMKFTNAGYGALDGNGDQSSGRGNGRPNGHIHTTRHSHIGRHGRSGHPSVLDQSPFLVSQSQKPSRHSFINGSKQSRGSHSYRMTGNPKKNGDTYGYDFDGEGADDERTPLVGSVRVTRSRHARRPNSASLRQMEYMEQRQRSWLPRHGLCILLLIFLFLLAGGATTAVVGLMKPLTGVHVKKIRNVLASEQQIMFGLEVQAINSNLMTLTVNNMDVNIFAKSRYLGSESLLHGSVSHPHMVVPRTKDSRTRARLTSAVKQNAASISDTTHATGGIDRGTDPIFADPPEDPVGDPQTMLLGRIFHFDSPLTFESSPWRHDPSSSIGEVRLAKPGNKTEEGGTARWERVLQNPFELIVRGVVKYQLPLTSRMRSASINSQITVVPNDDSGGGDNGDDNNDGADKKPPTTPGHHNNDTSAETYQS